MSQSSAQLFRLEIVDEDNDNELVKVRYIGSSKRFDKWRPKSDVIYLNDLNTPEGDELRNNPSLNNADEWGMVFNNGPSGAESFCQVSKPFRGRTYSISVNEKIG